MNTMTTRSIAALAAAGAMVVGGAAAANATGDSGHGSIQRPEVDEVDRLVHEAVQDGTVTVEEETGIKQAIEDRTGLEFESLDDAASQS